MTTPVIVVKPSKLKAIVALIGTVLTVAVPLILELQSYLPPQYQAIIGGVLGLLTILGVYTAPYKPTGTVIVPADSVRQETGTTYPDPNPWA